MPTKSLISEWAYLTDLKDQAIRWALFAQADIRHEKVYGSIFIH